MSAINNSEELKDVDSNDELYTVMEDMKDRGVIIDEPTVIVLDTNVIDTSAPTNTNASSNASATNPIIPVVNDNDNDIRRVRAVGEHPIARQGSDRRSAFLNRQNRPAQLYPASQPCIYWLNGCCRFGDECHYRHQAPQMTSPSYITPSQSASFNSTIPSPPTITVPTKVKIEDNDSKANEVDDKKKRKGGKMKSRKGKEDAIEVETVIPPTDTVVTETVIPPTVVPPSISPMKKGKKKLSPSKAALGDESISVTSPSVESLKADLEAKMVIKATEFDSDSNEMMLLDLFQKSPKHFIQLVKVNDKVKYIPEDMVDRILESRNASTTVSLASIQDIINMLKLQIKKKDFITWNQDIIMAYSKQKLDNNQANIEEHEGQHIQVKSDSISADNDQHDDDNQEERYQQQRKKIEKKSTSTQVQPTGSSPSPSPSSSPSSPTSYEGDENSQYGQSEYVYDDSNRRNADITNTQIPLNNENSNFNGIATDAQMQGTDDPDNNYYYTYINPANGMQYAYPVSPYGYPNPNNAMPTEYMNQYPYGYYPSMDYYSPQGGNYNPMYSSPSTSPSRSSQTQSSPGQSSKPETSIQSPSSSPPRQDNVYAPRQDNTYAYGVGMEAGVDNFEQPNYYAPYDYGGMQYNQGYYPSVQGSIIIINIIITLLL